MYAGRKRAHGHRHGSPLSAEEKKEIVKKILAGETQIAVAKFFRVHPAAVARACKAAGVSRWATLTPKLEARAVALLTQGKGLHRVAKMTRLPDRVITEIMARHKIFHPVGSQGLEPEKRRAIADAVAHKSDYLIYLAAKFGVNVTTVRTIAREIWGDVRFIGGPNIPPLSSHYPQKNPRAKFADPPNGFAAIVVEKVCNQCFAGRLPPIDDARVVAGIMAGLPFLAGLPDAVLENIRHNLAAAVSNLRLGQTVASSDLVH